MSVPNPQQEPPKERLLQAGLKMFFAVGYNGTTVDAILAESNVQKGSFYHHFGSKQRFSFAVLDRYDARNSALLQKWADRNDLPVPARIAGYHTELVNLFLGHDAGHAFLAGKMSNELAYASAPFRERLSQSFSSQGTALASLLEDGQRRNEIRSDLRADDLASAILSMIEGAFAYSMAAHSEADLEATNRMLVRLVTSPQRNRVTVLEPGHRPPSRRSQDRGEPSHRAALLKQGMEQFFDRGYFGTTVDGVLAATAVPKGSFYHHFGTKQAFAGQVLDAYGDFQVRRLSAWADVTGLSTTQILTGYYGEMSAVFMRSGYRNVDLAAKLATEVAGSSVALQHQIAGLIDQWRQKVEHILAAGQTDGKIHSPDAVTDLSVAIAALINGSFIVAASTRSPESLTVTASAISGLVDADEMATPTHG